MPKPFASNNSKKKSRLNRDFLYKNYFFSVVGGGGGAVSVVVVAAGWAVVVVAASVFGVVGAGAVVAGASSITLEPVSLNAPVKLKLESSTKTINEVAKTHVLLSKKSVVFWTPPSICEPPIDEDKPPPLGFWTIITTINKKQTIVINTRKIENVLIVLTIIILL